LQKQRTEADVSTGHASTIVDAEGVKDLAQLMLQVAGSGSAWHGIGRLAAKRHG
jgi:hypothetical protein